MPGWATTGDVVTLTGREVSTETVTVAQTIVELAAGRIYNAADTLKPGDAERLRRAVAFQAVYVDANPDVFTARPVETERFGDMSVTYADNTAAVGALQLAPLAAMALRGVSWRRRPTGIVSLPIVAGRRTDVDLPDDLYEWQPYP